ncbi:MAG: caspase family protein [Smithellaceae bacterium]|nr:caspase family protein [Smithellaceae bacterium]
MSKGKKITDTDSKDKKGMNMKKMSFLRMVLSLLLVCLLSGLAPDAAFSQDRMSARRGRTIPAETPSVSAPKTDMDTSSPVKTDPTTTRGEAAAEKAPFGVKVQNLEGTAYWRMLGRHTGRKDGVLVADVVNGSPAEQMDIKKNDVILSFNYKDVKNPDEFQNAVSALSQGDKIVLSIYRLSPTLLTLTGTMGQSAVAAGKEQKTKVASADMNATAAIFAPTGHHGITAVGLSSDGKQIISGGNINNSLKLWDAATGRQSQALAGDTDVVYAVAFSPDVRYGVSGSANNTIKLWDGTTGKEIKAFAGQTKDDLVLSVAFSSDSRHILSGGSDNTLKLWDIATGREIKTFSGHAGWVTSVAFSPDGRYALSGSLDNTLKLWDIATGRDIRTFVGQHGVDSKSRAFAKDGTPVPPLIQLEADKMAWGMSSFAGRVSSVAFSPDGRHAVSGSWGKIITLWDIATGREIRSFTGHKERINAVAFSPDGNQILSAARDNTLKLWNVATGREIRTFTGHIGEINSTTFSRDAKRLISGGSDGTIRFWDSNTGAEIVKFVSLKDGEWIVITAEGYYNSSGRGHEYLNIRQGAKVYGIDQFYDVFYRPDIVAAKLRGDDIRDLVTLTLDEALKNPPPTVEFSSVPSQTDQPKVKVCYQAKSTGGGIGEVRLFHNGKLVQSDGYYREVAKTSTGTTQLASLNSRSIYADMRSINIKAKADSAFISSKSKGDLFEDCKEIDAIAGENEISVSAFNGGNTVQSYMKTVKFNSGVKPQDPHLYILSIGIDQYKDSSVNLKYAVKDAKDLEEKIKTQSATLYQPRNIHYSLVTDQDANKTNIINKINELANTIKPPDSFILFVAGHGILLQNQYYMLTHDFNGQVSDAGMISSNEIVEMSKKIKSLSQLFIFDTCHAGGVDTIISGLYDARMSVLAKKMGLHIYASANDKQAAMDGYKGNGLFTYTLLDGLNNNKEADKYKNGKISVVGLGEYARKMTTTISKQIGHEQTPLIINFGKDSPLYKLQ